MLDGDSEDDEQGRGREFELVQQWGRGEASSTHWQWGDFDVFVGGNQCEYFDNFHVFVDDNECGNAGDNGKLEDDKYVVNKVFKVTMMIINICWIGALLGFSPSKFIFCHCTNTGGGY